MAQAVDVGGEGQVEGGQRLLGVLAAIPDPRSRHGRRHPIGVRRSTSCYAAWTPMRWTRGSAGGRPPGSPKATSQRRSRLRDRRLRHRRGSRRQPGRQVIIPAGRAGGRRLPARRFRSGLRGLHKDRGRHRRPRRGGRGTPREQPMLGLEGSPRVGASTSTANGLNRMRGAHPQTGISSTHGCFTVGYAGRSRVRRCPSNSLTYRSAPRCTTSSGPLKPVRPGTPV